MTNKVNITERLQKYKRRTRTKKANVKHSKFKTIMCFDMILCTVRYISLRAGKQEKQFIRTSTQLSPIKHTIYVYIQFMFWQEKY